jgi:hypothetical protein
MKVEHRHYAGIESVDTVEKYIVGNGYERIYFVKLVDTRETGRRKVLAKIRMNLAPEHQSKVSAWEVRLSELADYRKIHGHWKCFQAISNLSACLSFRTVLTRNRDNTVAKPTSSREIVSRDEILDFLDGCSKI